MGKTAFLELLTGLGKPARYELLLLVMYHKQRKYVERRRCSSSALIVLALVTSVMTDKVTSLRERDVAKCILSDHPGVSKELLVTASERLVLWRLLLEYMNLIILRKMVGLCMRKQCLQAVFFVSAWERGYYRSLASCARRGYVGRFYGRVFLSPFFAY